MSSSSRSAVLFPPSVFEKNPEKKKFSSYQCPLRGLLSSFLLRSSKKIQKKKNFRHTNVLFEVCCPLSSFGLRKKSKKKKIFVIPMSSSRSAVLFPPSVFEKNPKKKNFSSYQCPLRGLLSSFLLRSSKKIQKKKIFRHTNVLFEVCCPLSSFGLRKKSKKKKFF